MSKRKAALGAAALTVLLAVVLLCSCESAPSGGEATAGGGQEDFLTVEDLVDQSLEQGQDGFYQKDGWLVKEEASLQPAMLDHAGEIFQSVYDTYLAGTGSQCYFAMVPGKHFFLGEGRPSLDYRQLAEEMAARTPFCTQLDLTPYLSLETYYRTDCHWRQEKLPEAARYLGEAMGTDVSAQYTTHTLDRAFTGNYLDQLNLSLPPETLYYLTSPTLESCQAARCDLSGVPQPIPLYDLSRDYGYDIFLSGAQGLVTIVNPQGDPDRELLLFRDSFGSSLAPLLAEGYGQITLVDLRYLPSVLLGEYLDFHGQDVLFLYSSLLLNNSLSLR
ncbi:MAG: hypothetical protein ACI3VS_09165 [Evtepia sp.]